MHTTLRNATRRQIGHKQSRRAVRKACLDVVRNIGPQRLETLEDRRLLSVVSQATGADYIAWEAELATITDPNANGITWRVIDANHARFASGTGGSTASAGQALLADAPMAVQGNTDGWAKYDLNFNAAGTYKMYIRRKHTGGPDNSFFRVAALDQTTAPNNTLDNGNYGALPANEYSWIYDNLNGKDGNTNFAPAVTAGAHTFTLGIREGQYVVDRIIFSQNQFLVDADLDLLVNSPATGALDAPVVTAIAGNEAILLNWKPVGGALKYNIARDTVTIATGVSGVSYTDRGGLANGTDYSYVVTAVPNPAVITSGTTDSAPVVIAPANVPLVAPTGLTGSSSKSTEVALKWNAVPFAETYNVKRSTSTGTETFLANVTTTSFTDTTVVSGTRYFYVVTAADAAGGGEGAASGEVNVGVTPDGWLDQDVNNPGMVGGVDYDAATGTFTVRGSGADIWGTADQFNYAYKNISGDGTILARINSMTTGDASWTKGGLMWRTDTTGPSNYMFNFTTSGVSSHFQYRDNLVDVNAVAAAPDTTYGTPAPTWLALVRSGDTFTPYFSADGNKWDSSVYTYGTTITNGAIPTDALVGFALTSHNNGMISTATFDHLQISAGVPVAPWTVRAVRGNGQIQVKWNLVPGATGYKILRGTSSGNETEDDGFTAYGTENSFIDTTAINGITYYYVVKAVNTTGDSAASPEVSARAQTGAPIVPEDVKALGSIGELRVLWTNNPFATSYKIYGSNTSGGAFTFLAEVTGTTDPAITTLSSTETGLGAVVTRYYKVTALDATLESARSAEVSATTAFVGTGTGLVMRAWNNNNEITANNNTANRFQGTWIVKDTDAQVNHPDNWPSPFADAGLLNPKNDWYSVRWEGEVQAQFTETYTFSLWTDDGSTLTVNAQNVLGTPINLVAGQKYPIVMTMWENEGGARAHLYWSSPSTSVRLIPQSQLYVVVPAAPVIPTAKPANFATIVSWTPVNTASKYNIYVRKEGDTYPATPNKTFVVPTNAMNPVTLTEIVKGLANGVKHYVVVKGVNSAGEGAASPEATVTPELTLPEVPINLAATGGAHQVALTWTAVPFADTYNIKRSPDGITFTTVKTGVLSNSYTDLELNIDATYTYKVSASNLKGAGPESTPVSALTGRFGLTEIVRRDGAGNADFPGTIGAPVLLTHMYVGNLNFGPLVEANPGPAALGMASVWGGSYANFSIMFTGVLVMPVTGDIQLLGSSDDEEATWLALDTTSAVDTSQLATDVMDSGAAPRGDPPVSPGRYTWLGNGRGMDATNPQDTSDPINGIVAGEWRSFATIFNQGGSDWGLKLWWEGINATTLTRQVIPATAFRPSAIRTAPATPSMASATSLGASFSIRVQWNDNSNNEAGFAIERSPDGTAGTWMEIAIADPGTTSYVDTGLWPGTTYSYRVRSFTATDSVPSDVMSATTDPVPPGLLTVTPQTPVSGPTNQTTEGNIDWMHWGFDQNPAGVDGKLSTATTKSVLQGDTDNFLAWEAENTDVLTMTGTPWSIDKGLDANGIAPSGGIALRAASTGGGNTTRPSWLTYNINVAQPGNYKIYARRKASGGGDNSLQMPAALDYVISDVNANWAREWDNRYGNGLDNVWVWTGSDGLLPDVATYPIWTANNPTTYQNVSAGPHTLVIRQRETNYLLDRIVLVKQGAGLDAPTTEQLDALANSSLGRASGPVSNVALVGDTAVLAKYDVTGKTFTWTDGSPHANNGITPTDDGIAVTGIGNGFRFTVPANTTTRRLKVYVAVDGLAEGALKVSLNDFSAPTVIATLKATGALKTASYTIEYRSGLENKQMTVEWTQTAGAGNLILQAADWIEITAPPAATGLVAGTVMKSSVPLSWTDNSNNESGFKIFRRLDGAGSWGSAIGAVGANVTAYTDATVTFLTNYEYRVLATNAVGDALASNTLDIAVPGMPAGWLEVDIGVQPTDSDVGDSGGVVIGNTTAWAVKGGGADIWDTDDQFHYVYMPVSKNVRITARVTGMENTPDNWAKAGVMFRNALDTSSYHDFMATTLGSQTHFQGRDGTRGGSASFNGGGLAWNMRPADPSPAPQWVRLERLGNSVTASWSADGITWQVAPGGENHSNPLVLDSAYWTADFYAGLAVTAHNNVDVGGSYTNTTTFDNVKVELLPTVVVAPTNLLVTPISTNRVVLSWKDTNPGEIGYRIKITGPGVSDIIDLPANAAFYEDTPGRTPGMTYTYRVFAVGWDGESTTSANGSAKVDNGQTPVGAGWLSADIGTVGFTGTDGLLTQGSTQYFDVTGSGADIWTYWQDSQGGTRPDHYTVDAFHFVYQPMVASAGNGSFFISGQIRAQQNTSEWARAGFMIREGPDSGIDIYDSGANFAMMAATPDHGVQYLWRWGAGNWCGETHTRNEATETPFSGVGNYLGLRRIGTEVTAWMSPDRITWSQLGGSWWVNGETVYAGMAVTATNNLATSLAAFKDVTIAIDFDSKPLAPISVAAVALGPKDMIVSWQNQSPYSTGYRILRGTNADGSDAAEVGTVNGVANTIFVDRGITAAGPYYYRVVALNSAGTGANAESDLSAISAPIAQGANGPAFNVANFADTTGWQLNGTAKKAAAGTDAVIRLTEAVNGQTGSFFTNLTQDISNFKVSFDFMMSGGNGADGMAFVLQGVSPTQLGGGGGALGYEGIQRSMAIKFDVYLNGAWSIDETGLYFNGANPEEDPNTTKDVDLRALGISLPNTKWHVVLDYDGTTLTETIARSSDPTNILFTHSWTVDIANTLGVDSAFVGFTGATGGLNIQQDVYNITWGDEGPKDWVIDGANTANAITITHVGDNIQATVNGTMTEKALASIANIIVNGNSAADTITLDLSGGSLVRDTFGITLNGAAGVDSLKIKGADGQAITIGDASATIGTLAIALDQVENVAFTASTSLASLTINGNRAVAMPADSLLKTGSLAINASASLNLDNGKMIVANGNETAIGQLIKNGQLKRKVQPFTTLTAILNKKADGSVVKTIFAGQAVTNTDVLVKFGWNGDSQLDGVVNADDYFQIDSGFISQKKGYYNGDFNYDGVVNADDYFLIDSSFIGSGGVSIAAAGDVVAVSVVKKPDASILAQLFSTDPVL